MSQTRQATDRYADLKAFVADWYRPIETKDGYTAEEIVEAERKIGFSLPISLRDLYQLIGKWDRITRLHNRLHRPAELYVEDGYLIVWSENQGVTNQGIPIENLSESDPKIVWLVDGEPIWCTGNEIVWREEGEGISELPQDTLSETALLMVALETLLIGKFSSVGIGEEPEAVRQCVSSMRPIPYPVLMRHRIFGLDDVLACEAGKNEIWVAARSENGLRAIIKKYGEIEWSTPWAEDSIHFEII